MKKFCLIPLLAALAVFVSCQKQQTDEERKAEVERQVQDRLAAERADTEKKRLADERAALDAREKAIADRETPAVAINTPASVKEAPPAEEETEASEARTEQRSTESYGMFYEKLDSYGEWRETNDYGYVWQPREAETTRDWRPYTEGRWAYSDAGWTWISDEPFGWATYHYGRWVRLRRIGWVWVPGSEWAPAWVSWRTSKDYVGWAPLPPEARFDRRSGIQNWADNYYDIGPDQYAFVSSNDFGAEHVRRSVVPTERNVSIVIETTNVTRITFANTMIMNEGPSYDELRSRGPRQIERYRLRRERNTEAQARVRGDELEVSVPVLSAVRNIFKPRRVKERVVDVNVDNGWTEIKDRSAAERARTKFKAEATPPPNAPPKKFVKPVETATASTTPAAPAASSTPAIASPTPATATTASATPATASPRPTIAKTGPSPTVAVASATPAATAASATPAVSASPKVRPDDTPRVRAPRPSLTATPVSTAAASPSVAASATPAASIAPSMKPSPSRPPRPVQTPPSLPLTTPAATTAASPSVAAIATPAASIAPSTKPSPSRPSRPVQTPPSLPLITPATKIMPVRPPESVTTPAATLTPPVRRPQVPPRAPIPTATPADASTTNTARPPVPRDVPRRTMPPRTTPPPMTAPPVASTPATPTPPAASMPAITNEPPKNRRPRLPVAPTTESGTPTPSPSPE